MDEGTPTLEEFVDSIRVPGEVDRDWLVGFLGEIGITADTPLAEISEDLFLHASGQLSGELEMRPGGWKVGLSGQAIKAALVTVVVGSAMFAGGMDEIPKEVLLVVVPVLVDIEKVRLNRREKELLVRLRSSAAGLEGLALHPQVLYDRFDAGTRSRLNFDDFAAFMDHLIDAGEADDAGYGDVRLRKAAGSAWIRLTWS